MNEQKLDEILGMFYNQQQRAEAKAKILALHKDSLREARIDELTNHVAEWLTINNETFDLIKERVAQLNRKEP